MELPIPKYFIGENAKVLKEREKLLGTVLAKMGPQGSNDVRSTVREHVCARGADICSMTLPPDYQREHNDNRRSHQINTGTFCSPISSVGYAVTDLLSSACSF